MKSKTVTKIKLFVDRASFKAYTRGVLMDRNSKGDVIVGDMEVNEEAMNALESGETIGFLVGNHLFSTMCRRGGLYVEELAAASKKRKP